LLIYPLHEAATQDEVQIRHTQTQIRQVTVDLTAREVGELARECNAFAAKILGSV